MGRPQGRRPVDLAATVRDSGARYAVTGATGWLGRAACAVLAAALGDAAPERLFPFASRERELGGGGAGGGLVARPLAALAETPFDVLLHYAFVTREQVGDTGLGEYVRRNVAISALALDAIARARPTAVVYASSGAVLGPDGRLAAALDANPYGTLKHLDELAFRRAAADVGARSLVLRVFNVAGPWIRKPEAFALSDLVGQARGGGPLTLRAARPVLRSYVDVEDLGAVAAGAAVAGGVEDDIVVATAGDEVVEVGALATRVAAALGRPDLEVRRAWDPEAAPDRYVGDGAGLRALAEHLGVPLRGLDEQIVRTARALDAR